MANKTARNVQSMSDCTDHQVNFTNQLYRCTGPVQVYSFSKLDLSWLVTRLSLETLGVIVTLKLQCAYTGVYQICVAFIMITKVNILTIQDCIAVQISNFGSHSLTILYKYFYEHRKAAQIKCLQKSQQSYNYFIILP